jgi:hypothetical protein
MPAKSFKGKISAKDTEITVISNGDYSYFKRNG